MSFSSSATLTITGNSSLLPATQTDFPVLVSLTNAALKTVGNGGSVQNANGYDIRFFSDSGLSVAIPFELESYDASTGAIVFWVKIASCALSTVFYMGYGDAALTTNASSTSTWDSDYSGVWHFKDTGSLDLTDSTSHGNPFIANGADPLPTNITGLVDGGASFNGTTKHALVGSVESVNRVTVCVSVKPTGLSGTQSLVMRDDNPPRIYLLRMNAAVIEWIPFSGSTPVAVTGGTSLSTSVFQRIQAVVDGTNAITYYNGVSDGSAALGALDTTGGPDSIELGARAGASLLSGILDEVRISKVARSANYLLAEYNSIHSPSTFVTSSFGGGGGGGSTGHPQFLGLLGVA